MAKKKIKTTPNSTGDRKPKPEPVEDPQSLKLWPAYQRAVAEGRERAFLKQHPNFRAKANATMPAKTGYGGINSDNAKTGRVIKTSLKSAQDQAQAAAQAQNPLQYQTDTGTAGSYIDPETGRMVMYSEASDPQRQILAGGENLSISGQNAAQGNVNDYSRFQSSVAPVGQFQGGQGAVGASNALIQGYDKFGWQGSPEERQRIEDEVYNRLTRNVDRDYGQEFEQMEQRMYNRGIPLDPSNPAYKREMDALNEKYQAIKESAMGQAVQMGGEEMQRSYSQALGSHQQGMNDINALYGVGQSAYGANLTGQGQQFSQDLATQQQQMAETAALSQLGTGYMGAPQVAYQAPEFMQTNPAELWAQNKGLNIQKYGIDKAAETARMGMEGGGGGGEETSGPPII